MDGSYRLLAARYIRKQTRQLLKQLDGVRDSDDFECVHQARVASRRLRAGLKLFPECFPRKKVKRWRKGIRRLAQGLGPARDKDVQIAFVRGVLSGLTDETHRPGIARLLLRLEQGRQTIQPEVIRAVDRFEAGGVGRQMLAAVEKMRSKLKKRRLSVQSPFVFSQACDHICDRLNALTGYEDCLGDPEDHERHHAMRIAGKQLRYTLEICQPVYEGRLDRFVQTVKQLQTLLGDIHDCDVWVADLQAFLAEELERTVVYFGHARPFARLKPGLEYLREERRSHRQALFGQLVDYWHQLDQEGLWDELVQTSRGPDEEPVDAPRSARAPDLASGAKEAPASDDAPGRHDGRPVRKDQKGERPPSAPPSAQPTNSRGGRGSLEDLAVGVGKPGDDGH
jgi:CHAD domain-containing protein